MNIGGVPYDPTPTEDPHVHTPWRQPDMFLWREARIGFTMRTGGRGRGIPPLPKRDGWGKVTVMESQIPLAHLGLFAYKKIEERSRICGYSGEQSDEPPGGDYVAEMPGGNRFITGDISKSFGPYANDCRDDHMTNAKLKWDRNGKAYLEATKTILPGEEIFIDYGLDFWRGRTHRLRGEARADTEARIAEMDRNGTGRGPQRGQEEEDEKWARETEEGDEQEEEKEVIDPEDPPGNEASGDSEEAQWLGRNAADNVLQWTHLYFPELETEKEETADLLRRAFKLGSSIFGVRAANEWAEDFSVPPSALAEDDAAWTRCDGLFRDLVREKRRAIDAGRMNETRVEERLSDENPYKEKTLEISREGISLCVPDSYSGCGWEDKPPPGGMFRQAAPAVEKMMFDSYWKEGLSIVLTEKRVRTMESLGLCLASWAKKLGKECGRPITNGSGRRGMPPEHIINGKATKALAEAKYGPIRHPVIGDVARLIVAFEKNRKVGRDRVVTWKYDIAAAYPKLSYAVDAVGHVGVELRDGTFMFFLGGVFGLTSMPFAFNVITQAIVWELNHKLIDGDMLQYVDDGFVASLDTKAEEDIATTLDFLRGLLGKDAVAMHKLEQARDLDFIGYHSSLSDGCIKIAERNILKAIYAYGEVDLTPGAKVEVTMMQRLASLGSRYGYICRLLRPYVRTLYASYRGRSTETHVELNEEQRTVIRTFKHLFVAIGLRRTQFSRSFESFCYVQHSWVCEFDASLSGIGIIWFRVDADGTETAVAYSSLDITSLGFGTDASFQNTSEYMGSLLCARGLAMMGAEGAPIRLRGDSVSALSWAEKGTVRSDLAVRASAMWAQYVIVRQFNVTGTDHLSHELNSRADVLSRRGLWQDVLKDDREKYGGTLPDHVPWLNLRCDDLLQLANPKAPLDTEEQFNKFLKASLTFFDSESPSPPATAHSL